jgi:serine/threonine protein phosphatase PrpC
MNLNDCCLLGIMDGHGTNGHFVSQYIKEQAKEFFQNKENYFRNKNEEISLENIQNRLQSKNFSLIRKFYKKTNNELPDTKFDTHFSGSTCNLIFKLGKTIICSNTGDSRSIIIKENKNKQHQNNNNNNNNIYSKRINDIFSKYEVEELSFDHKPENKEEKDRILEKGGIVSQSENGKLDDGPFRVWVKGENYPGISMSRSLGDEVAESVGVISDPDFIVKNINDNYKYIVSGSDGLFEFMKNEDIMDIINPFFLVGDVEGACKELGKRAAEEWDKLTEERDDITFIILFIGNVHVKKETI